MDKRLENFINEILETKANNTGITNAKCIAEHYKEIPEIIRTRSIKVLAESLNKKGFVITYNGLQLILQREKKKADKLNSREQITNVKEVKTTINTPAIDKTAIINQVESTPKENKPLTTKEIMAETERYNEQHEVEKAKKAQTQRDEKLLALINKQNKGK